MAPATHIAECARCIHHMKIRHVEGGNQPVTLAWPAHGGGPKPTRKPPIVRSFMNGDTMYSVYTTSVEVADRGEGEEDTIARALEFSRVAENALEMLNRSIKRYRAIPRWRRDIRVPKRKT